MKKATAKKNVRRASASVSKRKTAQSKRRATSKSTKQKAVTTVSRARATTPARSTHPTGHTAKPAAPVRVMRDPLPLPMPTRHVAPVRPVIAAPARSMPPPRDQRKLPTPVTRGPLAVPDFTEAGVMLAITYSIRDGRRGEFFDLMRELKPLLAGIGGTDCTVYEDRSRGNYFMEVFRFKDEAEFTAFDDKFHKDRKIAAIYALLDDIVEAEKSDFKIFERRL